MQVWPALEPCTAFVCLCVCVCLCACISFQGQVFFALGKLKNLFTSKLLRNNASNVKPSSGLRSPQMKVFWWHFREKLAFQWDKSPFSNYFRWHFFRFPAVASKSTSLRRGRFRQRAQAEACCTAQLCGMRGQRDSSLGEDGRKTRLSCLLFLVSV